MLQSLLSVSNIFICSELPKLYMDLQEKGID